MVARILERAKGSVQNFLAQPIVTRLKDVDANCAVEWLGKTKNNYPLLRCDVQLQLPSTSTVSPKLSWFVLSSPENFDRRCGGRNCTGEPVARLRNS
jgi:hypothetical protein